MFSRHAPAARSLRTYRVSDPWPLRLASMRRSRSSPCHAKHHGCELSAEGAAMPARRMPSFVCRSTVRIRPIWPLFSADRGYLTYPTIGSPARALYAWAGARTKRCCSSRGKLRWDRRRRVCGHCCANTILSTTRACGVLRWAVTATRRDAGHGEVHAGFRVWRRCSHNRRIRSCTIRPDAGT